MTRIEVQADCPGRARSLEDPASFLPAPARPSGPDRWSCRLAVGPLRHPAMVTLGPLWRDGELVGRPITWVAAPEPGDPLPWEHLTPSVHGVLSLDGDHVVLRAAYVPPAGIVGRALDLVLGRVARRSMAWFVRDVAGRLCEPAATSQEA